MRYTALLLCIICLFGSFAKATDSGTVHSSFRGNMSFTASSGMPIDEDFAVTPPEIWQNLSITYQAQRDKFLMEVRASSYGVFGATPYLSLPDINFNFSIDEAYLGILTKYGTIMLGRYAPLMPVSPDDYRTDGLLFGNESLAIDAVSVYNQTEDLEYEWVLGYLSYSRGSATGKPSADLFAAARLGFDYQLESVRLSFSPGVLLSDLGESLGVGVPFRLERVGHVLTGEVALYALFGSSVLKEGLFPAAVVRYHPNGSPIEVEVAYIAQNFLPYLGNFANFGGTLDWSTGSSGIQLKLVLQNYICSLKFEQTPPDSRGVFFDIRRHLPQPFSPLSGGLGVKDRKGFISLKTGLTFSF